MRKPSKAAVLAPPAPVEAAAPYHHGDLRAGLLAAAERILVRDGIQGLTLRAAAREAGVSHAAPKNHFGDLTGLLSDLAAVGFERFNLAMRDAVAQDGAGSDAKLALGQGYVAFARANPGLFLLMFRAERLDFTRPALKAASADALNRLAGEGQSPFSSNPESTDAAASTAPWPLAKAAGVVSAWAFVHGLAMLLIDGRLAPIINRLPAGTTEADLMAAIRLGRE